MPTPYQVRPAQAEAGRLAEKVAVVTGANGGIGLAASLDAIIAATPLQLMTANGALR